MIYYFSLILIILGVFLIFTGTLGIIRFPDFFSRLHASSLLDSFGAPFTLVGFAFFFGFSPAATLKILLLVILWWMTSTITEYVISKARLREEFKEEFEEEQKSP